MASWGTFRGDSSGSCGAGTRTCSSAERDVFAFEPTFTGGIRVPTDDVVVDGIIITAENPSASDATAGGTLLFALSDGSVRFTSSDFDLI